MLTGWERLEESVKSFLRGALSTKNRGSELAEPFAGRWNRIRKLGFGSFGEVWLVQEENGGMFGVAKIPHNAKMNAVFIREAAILKRLEGHSNCVQIKEVIEEDGKVVLIEEYVEGETLQDLLDQGMEPEGKERAFSDLLDFLAYAHEKRIMHRDIKPENIIIRPSGSCKLLDFGTGKDLMSKTTSSTVVGSRPYMAPEQISGKSSIASDVWALGVLLYALATGLLPFYDENQKNLMDMILECDPEPPRRVEPEIPEELEEIILKCLRKDPDQRFQDAGELKDRLLEVLPDFGDGNTLPPV
jgi:serine/threonine protein kinase